MRKLIAGAAAGGVFLLGEWTANTQLLVDERTRLEACLSVSGGRGALLVTGLAVFGLGFLLLWLLLRLGSAQRTPLELAETAVLFWLLVFGVPLTWLAAWELIGFRGLVVAGCWSLGETLFAVLAADAILAYRPPLP